MRRYRYGVGEEEDQIGAVTGLAWTEVGGELLTIEAVTVPGKGQIKTTGKLGEVMQESIQAAMSFVKARAPAYGVKPSIFAKKASPVIAVNDGKIVKVFVNAEHADKFEKMMADMLGEDAEALFERPDGMVVTTRAGVELQQAHPFAERRDDIQTIIRSDRERSDSSRRSVAGRRHRLRRRPRRAIQIPLFC